jgi:hypothetical protein
MTQHEPTVRAIVTGPEKIVRRFAKAFNAFAKERGLRVKSRIQTASGEDLSQANLFCLDPVALDDVLVFLGVPPNPSSGWMIGADVVLDVLADGQALRFRKSLDPGDEAGATARLDEPLPSLEVFSEWCDTLWDYIPPEQGFPILLEMLLAARTPEDRLLLLHALAIQKSELPSWNPEPEIVARLSRFVRFTPEVNPDLWAQGCWAAGSPLEGSALVEAALPASGWLENLTLTRSSQKLGRGREEAGGL